MTPRTRPALSLLRSEPDQVPRLRAFREQHPRVVIGTLGPAGAWQARIPEENGETVVTRYLLKDLLDRLDELLGEPGRDGAP
jgi:hypothetical protein